MGSKFEPVNLGPYNSGENLEQKMNPKDVNGIKRNIYGAIVEGPVNMINEVYGK